jgi:hypothetical protein
MLRQVLLRRLLPVSLATARGLLRHPEAALPSPRPCSTSAAARRPRSPRWSPSRCSAPRAGAARQRISGLINNSCSRRWPPGHRYLKNHHRGREQGAVRQLTSWGSSRSAASASTARRVVVWLLDLASCDRVEHSSPL